MKKIVRKKIVIGPVESKLTWGPDLESIEEVSK